MITLLVKQTLTNGATRTWRLRPDGHAVTLGASRLAELSSMDPKSEGIEGAFEFREGRWMWISMNFSRLSQSPVMALEETSVVKLSESEMSFGFHEKDDSLYSKLQTSTAAQAGTGTTPFELEIVKHGDRVLSTKVVRTGAKESSAAKMASLGGEKFSVVRRPVHLSSQSDLMKAQIGQIDNEAKRGTAIVAVCSVLFTAAAVFGPHRAVETPVEMMKSAASNIVIDLKAMAPKKNATAERKPASTPPPTPVAGEAGSAQGGRVAGLLKAVSGGKLSQLLGKVSAQAARSREVVVQAGVRAGDGPSGRALSALGQMDRGGGDWTNEARGTGVTVSTAGSGGGRGIAGLAGLAAGKTGQAGVGLIEDESEITGGLDREIIAQTIKAYLGQILYCYERQLSASPELFGKVAVRFTIGPTGGVMTQAIGDTTLRNATVEGCILNKVASWKFPAPNGGTKVMVTYPFLFKSTN